MSAKFGAAADFFEESEKLIPLRSSSGLQILNNRGDIVIEGWNQDKIRLKVKKKTTTADATEAARLLGSAVARHREIEGSVEISAEYGQGLTLQERLRERDNPKTSMEMVLSAPAHAQLQILAFSGKIVLRHWRAPVQIRSAGGEIHIENSRGENIFVLCPSCSITAKDIQAAFRCVGGNKPVFISSIRGDEIFVETAGGSIQASDIRGYQLYVSKTGPIKVLQPKGHVEFSSGDSQVEIEDVFGFVSGRTVSGNITARISEWDSRDKSFIESISGNILLELPRSFSGELELMALPEKIKVESPFNRHLNPYPASSFALVDLDFDKVSPSETYLGDSLLKRVTSKIGSGGEQLRVLSESGSISVRPRK
jgi:DUF4097 and DUF4098 domain-containing protein YvlB